MIEIALYAFAGMMFAWFVIPEPPVWVTRTKKLAWNKVKSWFETTSSI